MLRPGQAVAVCVLALLTIGVVMVNSAGMQIGGTSPQSANALVSSKPTMYAALAVLAMLACALLPIRRLLPASLASDAADAPAGDLSKAGAMFLSPTWFKNVIREYVRLWPLWLGALVLIGALALVYVPGIERPRNGSHRWITLHIPGLESIQPSEIAKWGLVVLIAWYCARSIHRMKSFWLGFVPGLAAAGFVAGFVVIEDLGTGALLGAAACIVLLAAGGRLWQLVILTPVPVAGAILAVVTNPYRMHRIEAFLNPYLDPQGKGFHMIQSMVAVAGGGGFGRGLGHGLQKFDYLPEDTTDFLFAIICEEMGIAGAALVLSLFAGLIWALWLVVRRERVPVLKLFSLGVLATIGVQAVINLVVVTGLGPTKGIALPLLSSGGTGWILTAAALGLVIAIDRAQAREGARLLSGIGESDMPVVTITSAPAMMMATVAGAMAASPALAESSRDQAADPTVEVAAASSDVEVIEGIEETTESEVAEADADAEVASGDTSSGFPAANAESKTPSTVNTDSEVEPGQAVPSTSTRQSTEVAPGETGLLFDIAPEPKPQVVVTKTAKVWAEERRGSGQTTSDNETSKATDGEPA
jgi:cell division protein FtsW